MIDDFQGDCLLMLFVFWFMIGELCFLIDDWLLSMIGDDMDDMDGMDDVDLRMWMIVGASHWKTVSQKLEILDMSREFYSSNLKQFIL